MSQKQITALIIIFLYMIATIAIGLIVSKMKSKKKASQSNEDFLMAGKSLGPLTLAGTLFAANTGGASTTGIATNRNQCFPIRSFCKLVRYCWRYRFHLSIFYCSLF